MENSVGDISVGESVELSQHASSILQSRDQSTYRMEPIGEYSLSPSYTHRPIAGDESHNLTSPYFGTQALENVALDLSTEAVSEAVSELIQEKDSSHPQDVSAPTKTWSGSNGDTGLLIDLSEDISQHQTSFKPLRPSAVDSSVLTQYSACDDDANTWQSVSQHSDDAESKLRDSVSSGLSQTRGEHTGVVSKLSDDSSSLSRGKSSSPEYLAMFSTRPGTVIEKTGGSNVFKEMPLDKTLDYRKSLINNTGIDMLARESTIAYGAQDFSQRYSIGDTLVHSEKEPIVASTPYVVREVPVPLEADKDVADRSDSGRASSPASGDLAGSRTERDFNEMLHNLSLEQDIDADLEQRIQMINRIGMAETRDQASGSAAVPEVNSGSAAVPEVNPYSNKDVFDSVAVRERQILSNDREDLITFDRSPEHSIFTDCTKNSENQNGLTTLDKGTHAQAASPNLNNSNPRNKMATTMTNFSVIGQSRLPEDSHLLSVTDSSTNEQDRPRSAGSNAQSADTTKESDLDDIDRIAEEYRSILHNHLEELGPTGFTTTDSDTGAPRLEDIRRQHEEKKSQELTGEHSKPENVLLEASHEFRVDHVDKNTSGSDTEDALDRDVKRLLAKYGRSFSDSEDDGGPKRILRRSPTDSVGSLESDSSRRLAQVRSSKTPEDGGAESIPQGGGAVPSYLFDDPAKSMSLPYLGDTFNEQSPQVTVTAHKMPEEKHEGDQQKVKDINELNGSHVTNKKNSDRVELSEDELGHKIADVLDKTNHLQGGKPSHIKEVISDMESLRSSRTGSIDYGTLERDLDEIELNLQSTRSRSQSSDRGTGHNFVNHGPRSAKMESQFSKNDIGIEAGRVSEASIISGQSAASLINTSKITVTSGVSEFDTPRKYTWDHAADLAENSKGMFVSYSEIKPENEHVSKVENPNLSMLDLGVDPILTSGVIPMDLALEIVHDKHYITSGRPKYSLETSYSSVTGSPKKSNAMAANSGKQSSSAELDAYLKANSVDADTLKTNSVKGNTAKAYTDSRVEDQEVASIGQKALEEADVANQSFSERVQGILERGSPPRQAYQYLQEAEQQKEILERSYREHEKCFEEYQKSVEQKTREAEEELMQQPTVITSDDSLLEQTAASFEMSPVKKLTPFNKFGNVRSIFSSQLDKASARVFDLDKSIEFGSPAKRYIKSRDKPQDTKPPTPEAPNIRSDSRNPHYRHSPVNDQLEDLHAQDEQAALTQTNSQAELLLTSVEPEAPVRSVIGGSRSSSEEYRSAIDLDREIRRRIIDEQKNRELQGPHRKDKPQEHQANHDLEDQRQHDAREKQGIHDLEEQWNHDLLQAQRNDDLLAKQRQRDLEEKRNRDLLEQQRQRDLEEKRNRDLQKHQRQRDLEEKRNRDLLEQQRQRDLEEQRNRDLQEQQRQRDLEEKRNRDLLEQQRQRDLEEKRNRDLQEQQRLRDLEEKRNRDLQEQQKQHDLLREKKNLDLREEYARMYGAKRNQEQGNARNFEANEPRQSRKGKVEEDVRSSDKTTVSPTEDRLRLDLRRADRDSPGVVIDALSPPPVTSNDTDIHASDKTGPDKRGSDKAIQDNKTPSPDSESRSSSRERTPRFYTPHLVPYRPQGSQDVYYVESGTDDASVTGMSEVTVESTHPGSDDARGPSFPPHVLGSRKDAPHDGPGIYSKDAKAMNGELGTIQEHNSFSNGSSDKDNDTGGSGKKSEESEKSRRVEDKERSLKTVEEWMNGSLGSRAAQRDDDDEGDTEVKSLMEDELSSRENTPDIHYRVPADSLLVEDQLSPDRPKWDSDCFSTPQKAGSTSIDGSSFMKEQNLTETYEESPPLLSKNSTGFSENLGVSNDMKSNGQGGHTGLMKTPVDDSPAGKNELLISIDDSSLLELKQGKTNFETSSLSKLDSVKSSPGLEDKSDGDLTRSFSDPTLKSLMLQRSALPVHSKIRQQREAVFKRFGYGENTETPVTSKPPIHDQALDREKDYHRRLEARLSPLTVREDEFRPLPVDKMLAPISNHDDIVEDVMNDTNLPDNSADTANTEELLILAGVKTPELRPPEHALDVSGGFSANNYRKPLSYETGVHDSYKPLSYNQTVNSVNCEPVAYSGTRSNQYYRSADLADGKGLGNKDDLLDIDQDSYKGPANKSPSHNSQHSADWQSPGRTRGDNVVECSPEVIQHSPSTVCFRSESTEMSPEETRQRERREREYQRLLQKAHNVSGGESLESRLPSNANAVWKKFQKRQLDRSDGSSDEGSMRLSSEVKDMSSLLRNPVQHFVRSSVGSRSERTSLEAFEAERQQVESWRSKESGTGSSERVPAQENRASDRRDLLNRTDTTRGYYYHSASGKKLSHGGNDSSESSDYGGNKRGAPLDRVDDEREGQSEVTEEQSASDVSSSDRIPVKPRKHAWVIQDETLASVPEDSTLDSISSDFTTSSELDSDGKLITHTTKRHLPDDPKLLRLQRKISIQKEKYKKEKLREQMRKDKIREMEQLLREKGRQYQGKKSPGKQRVVFSEDAKKRLSSGGVKSTSTPSKYQESSSGSTSLSLSNITTTSTTLTPDETTLQDTLSSPERSQPVEQVCNCQYNKKYRSPERKSPVRKTKSPSRERQSLEARPPGSLKLQRVDYSEGRESRKLTKKASQSLQKQRSDKENNTDYFVKKSKNSANMKEKMLTIKEGDNIDVYLRKPDMVDSGTNFPSPIQKSPKRRYHGVSMISEGIQTSPAHDTTASVQSKKARSPKRGREKSTSPVRNNHESIQMFVPENSVRRDSSRTKRKKKLKVKSGVSWFIPHDEPKPWRKPLQERQDYAKSLTETIRSSEPKTSSDLRQKQKLEAWTLGTENAEKYGSLEADIYMQRSRSSLANDLGAKELTQSSLQEAFRRNNQWFISRSRERQRHVALRAEERRIQELHLLEREQLFGIHDKRPRSLNAHPLSEDLFKPKRRFMTRQEMKELTMRTVRRLPEVVKASEEKKRQEEYKTNRLRAKLYKQRVLRQVLSKKKSW